MSVSNKIDFFLLITIYYSLLIVLIIILSYKKKRLNILPLIITLNISYLVFSYEINTLSDL